MRRAKRKWIKPVRRATLLVVGLWGAQMLMLWSLRLGWSDYWWWRGFYRPGLRLYTWLFQSALPNYYFSPLDRTGATAGFAFATLVYALVGVSAALLLRKLRK